MSHLVAVSLADLVDDSQCPVIVTLLVPGSGWHRFESPCGKWTCEKCNGPRKAYNDIPYAGGYYFGLIPAGQVRQLNRKRIASRCSWVGFYTCAGGEVLVIAPDDMGGLLTGYAVDKPAVQALIKKTNTERGIVRHKLHGVDRRNGGGNVSTVLGNESRGKWWDRMFGKYIPATTEQGQADFKLAKWVSKNYTKDGKECETSMLPRDLSQSPTAEGSESDSWLATVASPSMDLDSQEATSC